MSAFVQGALDYPFASLGPGIDPAAIRARVASLDRGAALLVIQDGYRRLPDGTQNFKYVAWSDVVRALGLPPAR